MIFGFGQGEELSEHTASMPAVVHFLQGEATVTLGEDTLQAKPGTWVHMPTGLRHSIQAKTPVVMLLLLVKESRSWRRSQCLGRRTVSKREASSIPLTVCGSPVGR